VRQIGRYRVEREIGRGGMARVHLAQQPDLERAVALKELAGLHATDATATTRFVREARLGGSLNHPNIVTVHEYFEHGGLPWIALALAFSFGSYGLFKKKADAPAVQSLAVETAVLTPAAIVYLAYLVGLHVATAFAVGPGQTLTVTRPYADGRSGDETVAVYPRGQYLRAERLPEGTPPPDNTPLVG